MIMQKLTPRSSLQRLVSAIKEDAIHQLHNAIMSLEDAKFKNDIYALIVDFTPAFNSTDHDWML